MKRPTTTTTLILALVSFTGAASAEATDPSRTLCGAWALPTVAAGCSTVNVTWGLPTCTGTGDAYQCTVLFDERWTLLGTGCVFSDVDQYGSGYGGLCTTGQADGHLGPVPVTYGSIPAGGSVVTVTATACFSADDASNAPAPGRSTCETWTVGTIDLPGEGDAP